MSVELTDRCNLCPMLEPTCAETGCSMMNMPVTDEERANPQLMHETFRMSGAEFVSYRELLEYKPEEALIRKVAGCVRNKIDGLTQKRSWFFTFGCGIDQPHRNKYVEVFADHSEEAREKMSSIFGNKWCMQYDRAEDAGVAIYGLVHLATIW